MRRSDALPPTQPTIINDPRLVRHELGLLKIADIPSAEALLACYTERYFQTAQGGHEISYSDDELRYFDVRIERRAYAIAQIHGEAPGTMLDLGRGEGFAPAWLARHGWTVEGLDRSRAGLTAMSREMVPHIDLGDIFGLLDERIRMEG